jgi:hypothetical protein
MINLLDHIFVNEYKDQKILEDKKLKMFFLMFM